MNEQDLRAGIEALLDTTDTPSFSLNSVTYDPADSSSIFQDPIFEKFVEMAGPEFRRRPIRGLPVVVRVIIAHGADGLITAQLDLKEVVDFISINGNSKYGRREIRLKDIPVPEIALSPYTQEVIWHTGILDNQHQGTYTLGAKDAEGSRWSMGIDKTGLRPIRELHQPFLSRHFSFSHRLSSP